MALRKKTVNILLVIAGIIAVIILFCTPYAIGQQFSAAHKPSGVKVSTYSKGVTLKQLKSVVASTGLDKYLACDSFYGNCRKATGKYSKAVTRYNKACQIAFNNGNQVEALAADCEPPVPKDVPQEGIQIHDDVPKWISLESDNSTYRKEVLFSIAFAMMCV